MPVPTLPTPGDSEDVWGDILNAAITEVAEAVDDVASDVGDKADAADVVHRYGDETVEGAKTFVEPVTALSGPVSDQHVATKKYVDDTAGGGGGGAVSSVNGQTGDVFLDAGDVAALPADYVPDWDDLASKPDTFPPAAHNHDGRYYTESEVDSLLGGKAAASHTHDVGDLNATGTPDGTKFLRDDGVWATAAGGGGGQVDSVVAGTGIAVDDSDPTAPEVSVGDAGQVLGGAGGFASSVAAGPGATAYGPSSSAVGSGAEAFMTGSIALGANAKAQGFDSIAIGSGASVTGDGEAVMKADRLTLLGSSSGAGPTALVLHDPAGDPIEVGVDGEGYLYPTRPAESNITVVETIDDVPPGLPAGSVVLVLDTGEAADPPTIIGHSVVESAGSGVTFTPPTEMESGDIILAFLTSSADSGSPWTLDTDHNWEWISEPIINAHNRLTRVAKGVAAFSGGTQQTSLFSRTEAQRGVAVFVVLRGGSVADVAAGAVVGENAAGAGTTTVGGAFATSANALHLVFSYGNGNATSGHSTDAPVASGTLDSVGGGTAPTTPSAGFTAVYLWVRVLPASGSSGGASVVWPNIAQRGGVSVVVPPAPVGG